MILVDWQLHDRIKRGFIKIEPFDESFIQPNSVDIRLGNDFVWYDECDEIIDPYDRGSIESHFHQKTADFIDIPPGMFLLAETFETITLPEDVVATIEGKSSIARLGITLHQTGGWIDAGFSGTITLEICNANQRPVRLHAGMPIGQLVFYSTEKAEKPYGAKGDAKYLNQKKATLSRYHRNTR